VKRVSEYDSCHQQGHVGTKTYLQQNSLVLNRDSRLTQADYIMDVKWFCYSKQLAYWKNKLIYTEIYYKPTLGSYLLNWSSPRPNHSKHKTSSIQTTVHCYQKCSEENLTNRFPVSLPQMYKCFFFSTLTLLVGRHPTSIKLIPLISKCPLLQEVRRTQRETK